VFSIFIEFYSIVIECPILKISHRIYSRRTYILLYIIIISLERDVDTVRRWFERVSATFLYYNTPHTSSAAADMIIIIHRWFTTHITQIRGGVALPNDVQHNIELYYLLYMYIWLSALETVCGRWLGCDWSCRRRLHRPRRVQAAYNKNIKYGLYPYRWARANGYKIIVRTYGKKH